jgi:arylsulfatase A-like enzyme
MTTVVLRLLLLAPAKPNVVVILADDFGFGSVGCYGAAGPRTPNLDRFAREGRRFTDGYATGSVCSPTQYALMTGRYHQRCGHKFKPGPPHRPDLGVDLPLTETTLADRLKASGYKTGTGAYASCLAECDDAVGAVMGSSAP